MNMYCKNVGTRITIITTFLITQVFIKLLYLKGDLGTYLMGTFLK